MRLIFCTLRKLELDGMVRGPRFALIRAKRCGTSPAGRRQGEHSEKSDGFLPDSHRLGIADPGQRAGEIPLVIQGVFNKALIVILKIFRRLIFVKWTECPARIMLNPNDS